MQPTAFETQGGLEDQLSSLYLEREFLEDTLGVSDARQLVEMVQSMSAQLSSFYGDQESGASASAADSLSEQVVPLASALSTALGKVEVSLEGKSGQLTRRMRCRPL